jgi:hypothetical protein
MDPNEALRLIRLDIAQMRVEDKTPIRESADLFSFVQHARDLALTIEGLDEWLSKDGFLPTDWLPEEDKQQCTVEHGDWTGPHVRISSCPEPGAYDPHGGDKHRFYEEN